MSHIPNFERPMMVEVLEPKQCKTCAFRYTDCIYMGDKKIPTVDGWKKGSCWIFKYPDLKPCGVLENIEECEYYEKDVV